MDRVQLGIHYLSYKDLVDTRILSEVIYPDMHRDYYWSDDFSVEFYIAQAKAGFIAVTDHYEGRELLLPEIQYSYALLDFEDLHISKKVNKLLSNKNLKLKISQDIDKVFKGICVRHKHNWLTERYLNTLKKTQGLDKTFQVISAYIEENDEIVSGEIGYIIGKTYTSLSGFSSREKRYNNYGTAQLVLLSKYLEENDFSFWNLGQSYMAYKLALGARVYERQVFLKRWFKETGQVDFSENLPISSRNVVAYEPLGR